MGRTSDLLPQPEWHWVVMQSARKQTIQCISPEVYRRGWTVHPVVVPATVNQRPFEAHLNTYAMATKDKHIWRDVPHLEDVPEPMAVYPMAYFAGGSLHGQTRLVPAHADHFWYTEGGKEKYVRLPIDFDLLPKVNGQRTGMVYVPDGTQTAHATSTITDEAYTQARYPQFIIGATWERLRKMARKHAPDGYMHTYQVTYEPERCHYVFRILYAVPAVDVSVGGLVPVGGS